MISQVIKSHPLRYLIREKFRQNEWMLITRPASFLIKAIKESDDRLQRIIILPPRGHSADHEDELNPHPEARRAKITIKGGVRYGKTGFSILKQVLKYCYLENRDVETLDSHPYVRITPELKKYHEFIKSAKETFFVVRENGIGFYHSLINLSDDWLVLLLDKELRLLKSMDIESTLLTLEEHEQNLLQNFLLAIKKKGDRVYAEHPDLVNAVSKLEPHIAMPTLVEGLNIHDSGQHEACSVYATILKIGKAYPQEVSAQLQAARDAKNAPHYYLEELIGKLARY